MSNRRKKSHIETELEGMSPSEAASRWLVRLDGDEVTDNDRAAFEAWRGEAAANAAAFQRAKSAWDMVDHVQDNEHARALRQAALAVRPETREPSWQMLAASVVVLAVAALVIGLWSRPSADFRRLQLDRLAGPDYVTEKGERLNLTLPDGTAVTLNTETSIDVAFADGKRFVKLFNGQAYFEVAKDPDHPFIVEGGGRQVTALGTAFDVRVRDGQFEVLLAEGTVAVNDAVATPASMKSAPSHIVEPIVMTAGHELVVAANAAPSLAKADVTRELRWRDGFVEFQDETLAEAVAEFNRYAPKPIVIKSERVAALHVTGVFRTDKADDFVEAMSELHPVAVDRRAQNEVALVWSGD